MLMEDEAFLGSEKEDSLCVYNFQIWGVLPLFFDVDEWWKSVKIYITLVAGLTCCCHRHTFFDPTIGIHPKRFYSNCREFETRKVADFHVG